MMYQNKVAVALKAAGRVLRETAGRVSLPFGSEYSLYIKNLNPRRIKVRLDIDGKAATGDTWLVVPANSSTEIERFITDGNLHSGRRFRFIERSDAVEQHRGIGAEDGLVRVEFQVEKEYVLTPNYVPYDVYVPRCHPYPWWSAPYYGTFCNTQTTFTMSCSSGASASGSIETKSVNDAGITVPGSQSSQQFHTVADFETGPSDVIVLHLVGQMSDKPVKEAVTVDKLLTCSSCGRRWRSDSQFCAGCGTALHV